MLKLEHSALDVHSAFFFGVFGLFPLHLFNMKLRFILELVSTKEQYGWGHNMFSYLHLSPSSNINLEDLVLSHATQNIHTTLQGMCLLSTSHLLKSHSWGCKAVFSLAAWPVDPVLTTSVVNTMSPNVCGALWSQPGPHRDSNPPFSMQKENPGGEQQPDAPKEKAGCCTIHTPSW